jgi:hypothetical protein
MLNQLDKLTRELSPFNNEKFKIEFTQSQKERFVEYATSTANLLNTGVWLVKTCYFVISRFARNDEN